MPKSEQPSLAIHADDPGRDLLEMRDELGQEDGPGDIVFGPDFFDPRINGRAPYWEAILEGIDKERIILNNKPLTRDDLGKTAAELFPDAAPHELPALMVSLVAQGEPVGSNGHH